MKVVICAVALLCLLSCKKHSESLADTATSECKITSIEEFKAFYGHDILHEFNVFGHQEGLKHTYTYTNGRISKREVKEGRWSKHIDFFYNTEGKISHATTESGGSRIWTYTDGLLTASEAIDTSFSVYISRQVFTYINEKLTKVTCFYDENNRHILYYYDEIIWDKNGNVAAVNRYGSDHQFWCTLTFTYYTEEEDKNLQLAPQLDMLHITELNWFMFALFASNNLLKKIATVPYGHEWSMSVKYERNEKGFVTSMKSEDGTPYINFNYACN